MYLAQRKTALKQIQVKVQQREAICWASCHAHIFVAVYCERMCDRQMHTCTLVSWWDVKGAVASASTLMSILPHLCHNEPKQICMLNFSGLLGAEICHSKRVS